MVMKFPKSQSEPSAIPAEKYVLGAALKDSKSLSALMSAIKNPEAFYHPKNRKMFEIMRHLYLDSQPVDLTAVVAKDMNLSVHGFELVDAICSTVNTAAHCRAIKESHTLRQTIVASNQTIRECYEMERPVQEIVDRAMQRQFEIGQNRESHGFVRIANVVDDVLKQIDDWQSGKEQARRINTGFDCIDRRLHGLVPGASYVIGGRTSHGKTQLAVQIAENVAISQNRAVALLSLEMATNELCERMVCDIAFVNSEKLKTVGSVTADEYTLLVNAGEKIRKALVLVDDTSDTNISTLMSNARIAKQRYDIALLVIDYIQLMPHERMSDDTRERVVSELARQIKCMARDLDVPVLALSQVTPPPGADIAKPLTLETLRESKAISFHADVVLFTQLLDMNQGTAKIRIAKNRQGRACEDIDMIFKDGRWHEIAYGRGTEPCVIS